MTSPTRVAIVRPEALPDPVGFSHGVIASGPALYVAGQIAPGEAGSLAGVDFARQFEGALDRVLAVVRAAGAGAQDVARMTVYVTDMASYRRCRPALGATWRARFGRHYPAMALLGVAELAEPGACVEIDAVVALPATQKEAR